MKGGMYRDNIFIQIILTDIHSTLFRTDLAIKEASSIVIICASFLDYVDWDRRYVLSIGIM